MAPTPDPEPAPYLEHFRRPRHVGELEDADAVAEARHPACGDVGRLTMRIADGRVTEARFQCRGCSAAIGSLSLVTDWLPGHEIKELAGLSVDDLAPVVGPLPRLKRHALRLAHELLLAAVEDHGRRAS